MILRQMRFDPRHQHAGGKGLFDVIVRAETQPPDLVHILAQRRDHQNGDILLLAHGAADGKAIRSRQHQVEKQKIAILRQSGIQP